MADSPDGLAGIIAERYEIEREIGRGGMAVVYLARDLRHDAKVALKVLNPELAARVGSERFSREIRITANLRHPGLLSVFDSGEVEGLPFCVMPYVEGETLAARIGREGPLPIEDALAITGEIADGLAYAHEQGFVHRDVKPSNILLSHGRALLADFGIARAVDAAGQEDLTTAGLAVGTASYMSPEQASGGKVDGRSDVYSLACVLYEMLAGTPPFTGPTARSVLARQMADAVPSIRTVRTAVPPALETAINRAMEKLQADRYANAREFKTAVQEALRQPEAPQRKFVGIWLATAALILLALATLFGRRVIGGDGGLDPTRIVVFPLVVSAGMDNPSVGEDVATMIGNALDRTGPLRLIDGWALLSPDQRADIRELTDDQARAIARAERCGFYVTGRITAVGPDTAEVSLQLNDTGGREDPERAISRAPRREAWRGFRAVNQFLPIVIGGGTEDVVAEWEARPPLAIASFLLGESRFRRVHLDDALEHYHAAVGADSTFAIAAIRGAQAASWAHEDEAARALIETALRQPLQPRYAHFAAGYRAYLEGHADSAIAAFRAALALDDEMAVTWLQLGETWTHLLPEAGSPDDSALVAFEQVVRHDSTATNALYHLIEILLRKGDVQRAAPLVARFRSANPQGTFGDLIAIMFNCVRDGPEKVEWDRLAEALPFPLLAASSQLSGGGSQLPCALHGFSALLRNDTAPDDGARGRRFNAILGLQNGLLAQGREDEALARLDTYVQRWGRSGVGASLYVLDAPVYPAFAERARETARGDSALYGPDYAEKTFNNGLWELGVFEAISGNIDRAAAIAGELASRATGPDSAHLRTLAASLEARMSLARGDSVTAFRQLDPLVPAIAPADELRYDEASALGAERLEFARMLMANGNHERAIAVADVFDSPWPVVYGLYLGPSLRLRVEAAAASGAVRLEEQYRDRLAALQRR